MFRLKLMTPLFIETCRWKLQLLVTQAAWRRRRNRCKVTHFIWPLAWNYQLLMKLATLLQRPTFYWLRSASAGVVNVIIVIIIIILFVASSAPCTLCT